MSELTVILLGLLFISCPVTLFIGFVGGVIIYRAIMSDRRDKKSIGNHKRIRMFRIPKIPNEEVFYYVEMLGRDGWNAKWIDSKTVGASDLILTRRCE